MNWYDLSVPQIAWLIDGLIPSDGHAAICGKPKAGKSTFLRNLIVAIIKNQDFIGRRIEIEKGTGRVLYLHLDRKDQKWRVAKELRDLGIMQEESSRVVLRTPEDIPSGPFEERLEWLKKEIVAVKPQLVVIDLMWQFVVVDNANDYSKVLEGINTLQDALTAVKYSGALLVALHGRKATNPNDPADDMLGSTGQRGSFATNIFLNRYRRQGVYTIMTEQTQRDEHHGEVDETIIIRNEDGSLSLGRPFNELGKQEKQVRTETDLRRVIDYITEHPGCEMTDIIEELGIAKKKVLQLLETAGELVTKTGKGIKNDLYKYSIPAESASKISAERLAETFGGATSFELT
jgi:hypothetical protein